MSREAVGRSAGFETVRAFVIFGLLFAIIAGVGVTLAFRVLDLDVLEENLALGRAEARNIANFVERLGGTDGAELDFAVVREAALLRTYVQSRLRHRSFIDHVEVFDRFGVRQFLELRPRRAGEPVAREPAGFIPPDWPALGDQVVQASLSNGQGEVRLSVTPEPIIEDLEALRRSLMTKIMAASILAGAVLIAGFFYVLFLIRRNRLLEQSRQSAARASYVGLLASGLAHEIRNPLNAMNMNLQMLEEDLQEEGAGEDHLELLDSTKSEIKRLERLVNNFLAYARPAPPRFESHDLNETVGEVVRLLENDFRQSGVEIAQDLAAVLPRAEIDDAQFKQALINLLVNARQVLKDGGVVRVTTGAGAGGELVLEVADDGPGIPVEMRDRIFEVFYSSRGGGTGLGLPIARQVIERHGGTISVESSTGEGTTFRIRLPRRHSTPAPVAEAR